jgi:predicted DNA-binding transcriptional regulator AlpA
MSDINVKAPADVQELMKKTGRSKTIIYALAKKLGRLPTVEEVLNRKPGRPRKY